MKKKLGDSSLNLNSDFVFLMINPWVIDFAHAIIDRFDQIGNRLRLAFVPQIPLDVIANQYKDSNRQPFFMPLIYDLAEKPAVIAIYHGDMPGLLSTKREVREAYASHIEPILAYRRDAVHTSVNRYEFNRESKLWMDHFKRFKIPDRNLSGAQIA